MKKILLISTNTKKHLEVQTFFNHYGISVELLNENINIIDFVKNINTNNYFMIMKEKTKLFRNHFEIETQKLKNLDLVSTFSEITYFINNKIKTIKSKTIKGFIDLSRKKDSNDILGWDDIFVISKLGISLQELKEKNLKNIGRQELLAQLAQKTLYYKDRLDLNFNKQDKNETISIDNKSIDFIRTNKYFNSKNVQKSGFTNLIKKSIENGAMFRSSKNRREKNYWFPGLNAGIPLVAKKDEIHEITFAAHDFTHFLMPDLIFDGNDTIQNKKIYILTRMMSEAITMTLADGWFVSNLKKDFDYDFSKRKIYPLFEDLDLNNKNTLTNIVIPNMIKYCLKGDDKYLYNITKNETSIKEFKEKYDAFFVEDYKWTFKNYDNMNSNSETFKKWTTDLKKELYNNNLYLLSDYSKTKYYSINSNDKLIERFSKSYINLLFNTEHLDNKIITDEEKITKAFKKYMLGQMFIFYNFDFVGISHTYKELIKKIIQQDIITKSETIKVRKIYNQYLSELKSLHLINSDEEETYKEIYPLFNPYFVFYDKEESYYTSISSFYNKL